MKGFCMVLSIFLIVIILGSLSKESFQSVSNIDESVKGLFPTKGLEEICKKRGGYPPAYMPTQCIRSDGSVDRKSNCECMDKTMTYCTSCYPNVKHKQYNAKDLEQQYPYMSY